MNTVRAILDAEKEASRLCGEARGLQESRAARIEKDKAALSKQYADLTAAAIAEAEKAEAARVQAETARIQTETARRIDALGRSFDAARDAGIDRLFRLVIGDDDGGQ